MPSWFAKLLELPGLGSFAIFALSLKDTLQKDFFCSEKASNKMQNYTSTR
jgi:hypothetical protein